MLRALVHFTQKHMAGSGPNWDGTWMPAQDGVEYGCKVLLMIFMNSRRIGYSLCDWSDSRDQCCLTTKRTQYWPPCMDFHISPPAVCRSDLPTFHTWKQRSRIWRQWHVPLCLAFIYIQLIGLLQLFDSRGIVLVWLQFSFGFSSNQPSAAVVVWGNIAWHRYELANRIMCLIYFRFFKHSQYYCETAIVLLCL